MSTKINASVPTLNVAVYARYSTDYQRATSIDDQIRRCKETAQERGMEVSEDLIFSDAAISGQAKDTDKRIEYVKMRELLESGHIDVLIVDEISRISRDGVELQKIIQLFDQNKRLRLITADGVDSNDPSWHLHAQLKGVMSQHSTRETRHRVVRGMKGVVERGFVYGQAPFGYRLDPQFSDTGARIGTHFKIHKDEADLVRQIFEWRASGKSMHAIAKELNANNVPTSNRPSARESQYWRAARVRQLLANPIYRGEFHRNRTKRERLKAHMATAKELDVEIYPRPQLRIVSDELWNKCFALRVSRSGYGGATHKYTGLFSCNVCNSILVLTSKNHRSRSLYCANCTAAKSVNAEEGRLTSTIAVAGVTELLLFALKDILTPAVVAAFHEGLRKKLEGNFDDEIAALEKEAAKVNRNLDRASKLACTEQDPIFLERYREIKAQRDHLAAQISTLNARSISLDQDAVRAQVAKFNPAAVLERLLKNDEENPERIRTVLHRLFPQLVFEGKSRKFTSHFRITMSVGAAMAISSESCDLTAHPVTYRYELRCRRHPSNGNQAEWFVRRLETVDKPASSASVPPDPVQVHDCEVEGAMAC